MCVKTITQSDYFGKVKWRCDKPEYKDGLCARHYKRAKEKQQNWGDRKTYRPATQEDLDRGRSLKLKATSVHAIYNCRGGEIKKYSAKEDKFISTDIKADYNLFCVKNL